VQNSPKSRKFLGQIKAFPLHHFQ